MSTEKESGYTNDLYGELRSFFQTNLPKIIKENIENNLSHTRTKESFFDLSTIIESLEKIIPETNNFDEHDWVLIRNYIASNIREFLLKLDGYKNIYHTGSTHKYLTDIFGPVVLNLLFEWFSDDGDFTTFTLIMVESRDINLVDEKINNIIKEQVWDYSSINNCVDDDDLHDYNLLEEWVKNNEVIDFRRFRNERLRYSDYSIHNLMYHKDQFLMARFR